MSNRMFNRSAPNLTIAVFDHWPECNNNSRSFLTCDHAEYNRTILLIHMLMGTSSIDEIADRLIVTFYRATHEFFNKQWRDDLINRSIDIYGVPARLEDIKLSEIHYTLASEPAPYFMYASSNQPTLSADIDTGFWLLISPFTVKAWLAVIGMGMIFMIVVVFGSSLAKSIITDHNTDRKQLLLPRWTKFCFLTSTAFEFVLVIYDSNLKANVAVNRDLAIPFSDLYDLSDQIIRGQRRIIVNRNWTVRYQLLTGPSGIGAGNWPAFSKLAEALETTSSQESIMVNGNVTEICEILRKRPEVVFFGYDELMEEHCPRYCFWRYEVREYPVNMDF